MTSYVDFFVDFATSGQVAGVGVNSRPADWLPVLGDDFLESSFSPGHLIRGFGVIEANFANDTGEWLCYLVHIKPNRQNFRAGVVPPLIGERYGTFPAQVRFDDVAEAVAAAGAEIRQLPRQVSYSTDYYWVPRGKVSFSVASPPWVDDNPQFEVGDLIETTATWDIDHPPDHGTRYR